MGRRYSFVAPMLGGRHPHFEPYALDRLEYDADPEDGQLTHVQICVYLTF